jgi:hypothetical protein
MPSDRMGSLRWQPRPRHAGNGRAWRSLTARGGGFCLIELRSKDVDHQAQCFVGWVVTQRLCQIGGCGGYVRENLGQDPVYTRRPKFEVKLGSSSRPFPQVIIRQNKTTHRFPVKQTAISCKRSPDGAPLGGMLSVLREHGSTAKPSHAQGVPRACHPLACESYPDSRTICRALGISLKRLPDASKNWRLANSPDRQDIETLRSSGEWDHRPTLRRWVPRSNEASSRKTRFEAHSRS